MDDFVLHTVASSAPRTAPTASSAGGRKRGRARPALGGRPGAAADDDDAAAAPSVVGKEGDGPADGAAPSSTNAEEEEEEEEEEEPPTRRTKRGRLEEDRVLAEGEKATRKKPAMTPAAVYSAFHLSAEELSKRRGREDVLDSAPRFEGQGDEAAFKALGFDDRLARICAAPRGEATNKKKKGGDEGTRSSSGGARGLGLRRPTAVQARSAPALLHRQNSLIVAPTGSGKTLAYVLPVLQTLHGLEPRATRADGTLALVMAPTRELCAQIEKVANAVATRYDVAIVVGGIAGGEKRKAEKARLRKGVGFVVATPGRLVDHLQNSEALKLDRLQWLVLDEVDRLLDMGFGPQVDAVAAALAQRRIGKKTTEGEPYATALVTATISAKLQGLALKALGQGHVVIRADADDKSAHDAAGLSSTSQKLTTPPTLKQRYAIVTLKLRLAALCAALKAYAKDKVLVFVSTCAAAEFHAALLARDPARPCWSSSPAGGGATARVVGRLHGSMDRDERRGAYADFCGTEGAVLFATDVAARGVDFDEAKIDRVIHLDAPREVATYVHRAGRCARAGRSGASTLFLLPTERPLLDAIVRRVDAVPQRSALALRSDAEASECSRTLEAVVEGDRDLGDLAKNAFAAHTRAYAARPNNARECDEAELALLQKAFHLRKLHLGHAAKAFALKQTPTKLGAISTKVAKFDLLKRQNNKNHTQHANKGKGGQGKRAAAPSVGSNTRLLASKPKRKQSAADVSEFGL